MVGYCLSRKSYSIGFSLTLKRNKNNDDIIRGDRVDAAKRDTKDIGWYNPLNTKSMENQQNAVKQLLDKDPTELYYTERISRKDGNNKNKWTFEIRNT